MEQKWSRASPAMLHGRLNGSAVSVPSGLTHSLSIEVSGDWLESSPESDFGALSAGTSASRFTSKWTPANRH